VIEGKQVSRTRARSLGRARNVSAASIDARVGALDWQRIEGELDDRGYALTGSILTAAECEQLIALYDERERFRSRIVMERLNYGLGEYKYFSRPLPSLVEKMRVLLYERLAPIANRWSRALGRNASEFPPTLDRFINACHEHGQERPTPLILRYEASGYNCLHQDVYGEIAFPLQFTCTLSKCGRDFEGGELLLVEQRPRAQSRGTAIALDQGEGIIFPNQFRPISGSRGYYRVAVRHGVSTITRGRRFSLGVIFHDAK
jgi:uncharacterized protein